MRHALATLLAAAVLTTTVTPAVAGGPPGSVEPTLPDPPAQTRTKHYGTHVFLADLAVFAAVAAAGKIEESSSGDSSVVGLVGLGYFAAAPLVHLHHGNASGARKSLAARALMPVGGALLGMALVGASHDDSSEDDDLGGGFEVVLGMALGAMAGSAAAMVLDWTVFSKKTVEVKPAGFAVAPSVGVTSRSVSVGLAGSF